MTKLKLLCIATFVLFLPFMVGIVGGLMALIYKCAYDVTVYCYVGGDSLELVVLPIGTLSMVFGFILFGYTMYYDLRENH